MSKGTITTAIRNAIINYANRDEQIEEISFSVGCDAKKAKELFFAFIYHASEEFLVYLLQRGEEQ